MISSVCAMDVAMRCISKSLPLIMSSLNYCNLRGTTAVIAVRRRSTRNKIFEHQGVPYMNPSKDIRDLLSRHVENEQIDVEHEDEDEPGYNKNDRLDDPRQIRRQRDYRYRMRLKRQIDPREPSLLTWAARTQIKHLHAISPEEWTPDNIAAHFPISKDDARRLIRHTRLVPIGEENLKIHNAGVEDRWKALKSGRGGNMVSEEQRRRFAEKTLTKANYDGIPSLPSVPVALDSLPPPQLATVTGPFTNLIRTSIEARNQRILAENPELASSKSTKLPLSPNDKVSSLTRLTKSSPSRIESVSVDRSDAHMYDYDTGPRHPLHIVENVEENAFPYPEEEPEEPDTRIRRLTPKQTRERNRWGNNRLAMHDEVQDKVLNEAEDKPAFQKWFDRLEDTNHEKVQQKATQNVKEAATPAPPPRRSVERTVDEKQRLPKLEVLDDRIKIPPQQRKPDAMYQLNDSFYDADGDFLFRVPGLAPQEPGEKAKI